MNDNKITFNSFELRTKVKELIETAKKNNLIKPLEEAFKDMPVKDEIHKGNINNI